MANDLNAARKRRAGHADDGRCPCGRYRLLCREGCLGEAGEPPVTTRPVAELLADMRRIARERNPER